MRVRNVLLAALVCGLPLMVLVAYSLALDRAISNAPSEPARDARPSDPSQPAWQRHRLPNGLCSAELPWEPTRTEPPDQSSLTCGLFTSALFSLGTKQLAEDERRETDEATLQAIRKVMGGEGEKLPAVVERRIEIDRCAGFEWTSRRKREDGKPDAVRYVILVRNGTQYMLGAFYEPTPENEARAKRFFESFRFEPVGR